jgi:hypothetical protein
MRPVFNHSLISSVALYLDHQLCDGAQAYSNVTTGLFKMVDPSTAGHVWASPFKAWVADSCVSGAVIPSGVYNSSGQFLTRDSGVVIDFQRGRVISPQNWGPRLSGTFARKEFNVYTASEQEVEWWMENVFAANKDITYTPTGVAAGPWVAPCVILTNASEENEGWALGGVDNTKNTFAAYIISATSYQQEGVNSFFRDMSRQFIPLIDYGAVPFASSGDLKTGYYCFDDLCATYGPAGVYIENVHNVKVNQKANRTTSFFVSISEFDLSTIRLPRVNK